jgi:hypothetical protein
MSEIAHFNFHGDDLEIVRGAEVLVGIRGVCRGLGVDFATQLRKLKADSTMGVVMMPTPSPGGEQETACLPLRALPLWLATIHPSKVAEPVREKLLAYRREAADVLADHFIGPRCAILPPPPVGEREALLPPAPSTALALPPSTTSILAAIVAAVRDLLSDERTARTTEMEALHRRLDVVQKQGHEAALHQGIVSAPQVEELKQQVRALALRWLALGWYDTVRGAGQACLNDVYRCADWGHGEPRLIRLPSQAYGKVLARLAELRWEAGRAEQRQARPAGKLLRLPTRR